MIKKKVDVIKLKTAWTKEDLDMNEVFCGTVA